MISRVIKCIKRQRREERNNLSFEKLHTIPELKLEPRTGDVFQIEIDARFELNEIIDTKIAANQIGRQAGIMISQGNNLKICELFRTDPDFGNGLYYAYGYEDGIVSNLCSHVNMFEYLCGWIQGQAAVRYTHGMDTQEQLGYTFGYSRFQLDYSYHVHNDIKFQNGYFAGLGRVDGEKNNSIANFENHTTHTQRRLYNTFYNYNSNFLSD
jgi:hypothetical protein